MAKRFTQTKSSLTLDTITKQAKSESNQNFSSSATPSVTPTENCSPPHLSPQHVPRPRRHSLRSTRKTSPPLRIGRELFSRPVRSFPMPVSQRIRQEQRALRTRLRPSQRVLMLPMRSCSSSRLPSRCAMWSRERGRKSAGQQRLSVTKPSRRPRRRLLLKRRRSLTEFVSKEISA